MSEVKWKKLTKGQNRIGGSMILVVRYLILLPLAMIYMPVFALILWMNPLTLYGEFFDRLRSGEPFGPLDGGAE